MCSNQTKHLYCFSQGENREVGTITIVYKGQPPFAGEQVELTGQWTEHPRFGRQFQAASWKTLTPTGTQAMIKMLGSGVLTGVGPVMAKRIVEHFGDKTMEVLDKEPERLREVPGIGKKKAEGIVASLREVCQDSQGWYFPWKVTGISANFAGKIQALYGNTAITRM